MNSGFINRLVGTIIVVVAAIVFIPNILDGDKVSYNENFKAIPERPEFKSINLQEALSDSQEQAPLPEGAPIEEINADDEALSATNTNTATPDVSTQTQSTPVSESDTVQVSALKPEEPARKPDSAFKSMAYVVQLGAFSRQASVDALVKKLKANGFNAFTKKVKTQSGTLTKVFVGPELDKQVLEKQLPKLKELTNLNGRITQFQVTK